MDKYVTLLSDKNWCNTPLAITVLLGEFMWEYYYYFAQYYPNTNN